MDQQLEILINREWTAPWADRLLAFVADFSAWAPWLLGFLFLGLVFGNFHIRAAMLAAGLAVGLSDGVGVNLLKHTVNRPRPSQIEQGVRMVVLGTAPGGFPRIAGALSEPAVSFPQGKDLPAFSGMLVAEMPANGRSFPSGHAANNMAVATVLLLFFGWRGALYLPVALSICYSRIYTGSHWPLDILAGMIIGAGGGWMATRLLEFLWRRFGDRLFPETAHAHPELIP